MLMDTDQFSLLPGTFHEHSPRFSIGLKNDKSSILFLTKFRVQNKNIYCNIHNTKYEELLLRYYIAIAEGVKFKDNVKLRTYIFFHPN